LSGIKFINHLSLQLQHIPSIWDKWCPRGVWMLGKWPWGCKVYAVDKS